MTKWRLLMYVAVIISIAFVVLSPCADPVKRQLFSRYDLRYYRIRKTNPGKIQTIAVYNAGDVPIPKILIEVDIPLNKQAVISDFDFAPFDSDPRQSFLGKIGRASCRERV